MKTILTSLLIVTQIVLFSQEQAAVKMELVNFSNKKFNDFAPSFYKDGILFLSDRGSGTVFPDLYYSDFVAAPVKLKFHNNKHFLGQSFYDVSNDILYITKTSNEPSDNNRRNIAIYKSKIKKGKIVKLKKLSFCDPNYSYAYPQILDGKLLISSNAVDGLYSLIQYTSVKGKWYQEKVIFSDTSPILYPSYKDKNTLFFASKRAGGKGGSDLYKIVKRNGEWSEPLNLSAFNSEYDELGLLFIDNKSGYLSSNRLDHKDHIFKFTIEL